MCQVLIFTAKLLALSIVVFACAVGEYIAVYKHIVPMKSHESYTVFMRSDHESTSHYGLVKLDNTVLSGQSYRVGVLIEVLESRNEREMFQICLDVSDGKKLTDRSCQTAVIPVYSPSIQTIKWIMKIPFYVFGVDKESVLVNAEVLSDHKFNNDMDPLTLMSIQISPVNFNYYSVRLELTVNLSGLPYVLVYWPNLSFILGIGSFIIFIWIIVAVFWYCLYKVRQTFGVVGTIPVGGRANVRR